MMLINHGTKHFAQACMEIAGRDEKAGGAAWPGQEDRRQVWKDPELRPLIWRGGCSRK